MILFMGGLVTLKVLGIVFFVLLLMRLFAGATLRHARLGDLAMRTLRTRFANGEITEDEFVKRRDTLNAH